MPLSTRRSFNAARRAICSAQRLDGGPFKIAEFVAHDPRLQCRSLKHVSGGAINPQCRSKCTNTLN